MLFRRLLAEKRTAAPFEKDASLSLNHWAMIWQRILNQPAEHGTPAIYVVEAGLRCAGFASCDNSRSKASAGC